MDSELIMKNWLTNLATGQHAAHYNYLLEHGEAFDQIARKVPHRSHFKMENRTQGKGCYANSQRFALAYPGVKYYEGFRYSGIVVVNFAWNVVNGKVVEWTNCKGIDSIRPVYFGVEIPVEFLGQNLGKEITLPVEEAPQFSIPVRLDLGMPLLGWYLN
jgi:hypothetical protein